MQNNNLHVPPNWFEHWFDERYLSVYPHRDDQEAADFTDRWQIWDRIKPGDWCLDLGCGSGRYARQLASRGISVLGLDLSAALLSVAQSRPSTNLKPCYVRADMRDLPVRPVFSLVISLFTSFGYFVEDSENQSVLTQIYQLLKKDGILILDLPNRDAIMAQVKKLPLTTRTAGKYQIIEERSISRNTKRVVKRIRIREAKSTFEYFESVRLFTLTEMQEMLEQAGFKPLVDIDSGKNSEPWGNYQGDLISKDKPRMIFFGVKDV